jgi:flagellar hook-associated protein 2
MLKFRMTTRIPANTVPAGTTRNPVSSAEAAPRQSPQNAAVQQLSAGIAHDQTTLSGLGQLNSALATFQAMSQSIAGKGLRTAAVADAPKVLTAVTNTNAKNGVYAIDVKQLAQGQVLQSAPQRTASGPLGSNVSTTIQIGMGKDAKPGSMKTVVIDATNNSLDGIAAALKQAGVEAKVVKGAQGAVLELSAQSGAANTLTLTVSGDPALKKLLSYAPGASAGLTQTSPARDAVLTIDGATVTGASNVITGAIAGVALAIGSPGASKLTVGQDNAGIAKNIGNFADSFNNLSSKLKSLKQGDLKTGSTLAQVHDQLNKVTAGLNKDALAKAGITLSPAGELRVDRTALATAIEKDPNAISKLFTDGGKGAADKMATAMVQLSGSGGVVGKQTTAVNRELAALLSQKTKLTSALASQNALLAAQYGQTSQGTSGDPLAGMAGGRPMSLFDFLA